MTAGGASPIGTPPRATGPAARIFVLALFVLYGWVLPMLASAAKPVLPAGPPTPDALFNKAATILEQPDSEEEAAGLFLHIYDEFPDWQGAEGALWKGAQLRKRLALQAAEPDWEKVLQPYRTFITAFPRSQNSAQAYFEVAFAYYRMGFFREALTYFKVFRKDHSGSALLPQVTYWQAMTMLELGQAGEAEKLLAGIAATEDQVLRAKVLSAIGETFSRREMWAESLARYEQVLKDYPEHYLAEPELLRKLGIALRRLGREDDGRRWLNQYLNISEDQASRAEVLFELGESYRGKGDEDAARNLYTMTISSGDPENRYAHLAEMRLAQYGGRSGFGGAEHDKAGVPPDPAADEPYLRVVNRYGDHPLVIDALYSLFDRHRARGEVEQAVETGRGFLRKGHSGRSAAVDGQIREVLGYLAAHLLAAGEPEKLYELYRSEHELVNAVQAGDFMGRVGEALARLGLLDEAAAVYYRALAFPLPEEVKADLYFRRMEVYLDKKDYDAAERLLSHLQEIYGGKREMEMVNFLRGSFAELRNRPLEALAAYEKILPPLVFPANRGRYAEGLLRVLLAKGDLAVFASQADLYEKQGWLAADALQDWYCRAAETAAGKGDQQQAVRFYRQAVVNGMPVGNAIVQRVHLGLGDIFLAGKEFEVSREHFQLAKTGPVPILKKLAEDGLQQVAIAQSFAAVRTSMAEKPPN